MRKISAFILLCVFLLMLCAGAWADESTWPQQLVKVRNVEEFRAALKTSVDQDGTIELEDNIEFSSGRLQVYRADEQRKVTINLNGKNITATGVTPFFIFGGKVTIKGEGTISANNPSTDGSIKAADSVIYVTSYSDKEASLTIEKGVKVTSNICYGIVVLGDNSNNKNLKATLDFNGEVVVNANACAISGNGSHTNNNNCSPTEIIIGQDAIVTSTLDDAIYHPQDGTLTINGGTITGTSAIEMKSGNLKITGGTITATKVPPVDAIGKTNGTSSGGYAVAVLKNSAYIGGEDKKIEISGGTFTGPVAIAADDGKGENANYNPTMTITGGTFNNTEAPSTDYIIAGYEAVGNSGSWTVEPKKFIDLSTGTNPITVNTPGVTATPEASNLSSDVKVKLSGEIASDDKNIYKVSFDIAVPTGANTVSTMTYVKENGELATGTSLKDLNYSNTGVASGNNTFEFIISNDGVLTEQLTNGYVVINYNGTDERTDSSGNKTTGAMEQYVIYRLDFSGIKLANIPEAPTQPETPATEPETPSSGGGGGGGGGGSTDDSSSGNNTSTTTVQEKNEDAIMDVDIQPDDDTPEAQAAIDAAKQAALDALDKAETNVELTPEEAVALVQNQKDIAEEKEAESNNGGVVADTKVPAASDLPVDDSIASLNELSATPKVTEPQAPTPEEHAVIEEKLNNLDNLENITEQDKSDIPSDFNASQLIDSGGTDSEGREVITIERASNTLEDQASLVNQLFEEIKNFLTAAITGNNENDTAEHGVVIATCMPPMIPHTTGWFPLKVNMRHLVPGQRPRFWINPAAFRSAAGDANSASVAAQLAAQEGDAFFLDGEGNPTTTIKGDASKMTVVAYLVDGARYDSAFITVDATEKDKEAIEAIIAAEEDNSQSNEDNTSSKSSSGGCDSGFAALSLTTVLFLMYNKKKIKVK